MSGVRVTRTLLIPDDEIELRFTPTGGPGGQHANKVSTRVELTWNVDRSRALGPRQRARVKKHLAGRIDSEGKLRLTVGTHRSQFRNREEARLRLARLVAGALRPVRTRRPTEPPKRAREARLEAKRRRSDAKRLRRVPPVE